jgi:beta-galactosidase
MQEFSFPFILFGGDYNPDQWDETVLEEDIQLFKQAHINTVVFPVFSWAKLEPSDGVYHFAWLDSILDRLANAHIKVILATSTVSQPAWMSQAYPDILPVDIEGRKRTHGMRAFFCINSVSYRKKAKALATQLAKRYANHPALFGWHIANEYGTYCYCDYCQEKFRLYLKKRYGTIEELNARWVTSFWGRTVYDFSEIMLPTALNDDYRFNPAVQLDYLRFMTASTIDCFENEAGILREMTPGLPIYTNISGFIKKLDQFALMPHMSFAAWDNYPNFSDGSHLVALKHSIMRGSLDGRPFIVAEQTPNQQNWQPYNKLKRPGEVRLLAYQGIAHGADGSLFFQMRQSLAGQEKFHGAVISHGGRSDTRIFQEFSVLGEELESLKDQIVGSRVVASVALIFDWENWWALELASGPSKDLRYLEQVAHYYKAFHALGISVDVIKTTSSLEGYSVVLAPLLYMMKDGIDEKLKEYVAHGGTLVGTYLTGVADENDRCVFGDRPGPLSDVFGIWVEETDALFPNEHNGIKEGEKIYKSSFLCDRIHLNEATAIATYTKDFYAGEPCITHNFYGEGEAWYFGTMPEDSYVLEFVTRLVKKTPSLVFCEVPSGVEMVKRVHAQRGETFLFLLNHNNQERTVTLPGAKDPIDVLTQKKVEDSQIVLPPRGVAILSYI